MKLFTSNDHDGHYPVGAASVVVAHDEAEARELLDAALRARGLDPSKGYTIVNVNTRKAAAYILCDGNY